MLISFFTQQGYSALDYDQLWTRHPFDHPTRNPGVSVLMHSNRFFDSAVAARLYAQYLEQIELAEEVGFDGVMLNEHHNAAFCLQARINIMTATVAARTKRLKLLQLGNPLPTWDNPVQLAEELSMIDMLSGGRLVTGIVRGGGSEQLANNVNPAFNRDRMTEAHDLLIKAWTEPGPWRWEGDQYHQRVVNPWAVPLQKPHPRIFVPGVVSPETIEFAASRRYPFFCLNTSLEDTKRIWEIYDGFAREAGFEPGPQHRGYIMRCTVAETHEKAVEKAREHLWMSGEFAGLGRPEWMSPTGYSSFAARNRRVAFQKEIGSKLDQQIASGTLIAGTPDDVVRKIRRWLEETRPGMLILWINDGRLAQDVSLETIRMMGTEVLPAVREHARELQLHDPFEIDEPVSLVAGRAGEMKNAAA